MSKISWWNMVGAFVQERMDPAIHQATKFDSWRRQVEDFFASASLEKEPWEEQARAIRACMTTDGQELLQDVLGAIEDNKSLKKVLDELAAQLAAQRNVWSYRVEFEKRTQSSDEKVQEFIRSLQKSVKMCDYARGTCAECKKIVEDMNVTRKAVLGLKDSEIQMKCFQNDSQQKF